MYPLLVFSIYTLYTLCTLLPDFTLSSVRISILVVHITFYITNFLYFYALPALTNKVGQPLLIIDAEGEPEPTTPSASAPPPPPKQAPSPKTPKVEHKPQVPIDHHRHHDGSILAIPAVRGLAKGNGVDLSLVCLVLDTLAFTGL